MPETKTWIIVVLIIFAWVQYTWPDKVQTIGDSTFGKLNEYIKVKGTEKMDETAEVVCSDAYNPVCGSNGVTYDNLCKAALARMWDTTPGECENEEG